MAFIQTFSSQDGWHTANTTSFEETAVELGITLKLHDAQNDFESQIAAFHGFIADDEVDVIVLAALEPTGWDEVLREARNASKIVILENHGIDASEDLYATYIGSDFAEQGRKAADAMCNLLAGSEKKNVAELVGDAGSSIFVERGQGFREKMVDCGITITQSQNGNSSSEEANRIMTVFLNQSRDIQGVFVQRDSMIPGVILALKAAGLKPAVDIKIVSIDGTRLAFDAMIAGELNATVEASPNLAPQVYEAALKTLNSEVLPKWIPSLEDVFYSEDVTRY